VPYRDNDEQRAYWKAWFRANREKRLVQMKAWYEANREKQRVTGSIRYRRNRVRISAYRKLRSRVDGTVKSSPSFTAKEMKVIAQSPILTDMLRDVKTRLRTT
jgi:hypothetical protein